MEILAITERLLLRNWSEKDIDPYACIVSDPEVMKYIGDGKPRTREYAEKYVREMMAHQDGRGWMRFAVEHRETGELMGFCGFEVDGNAQDFGWRYARKFWGAGYGGEAALAALELGRERFGLTGIESKSFSENVGSVKIFDKLGMSFLRESFVDGRHVVHYGYPSDLIAEG